MFNKLNLNIIDKTINCLFCNKIIQCDFDSEFGSTYYKCIGCKKIGNLSCDIDYNIIDNEKLYYLRYDFYKISGTTISCISHRDHNTYYELDVAWGDNGIITSSKLFKTNKNLFQFSIEEACNIYLKYLKLENVS